MTRWLLYNASECPAKERHEYSEGVRERVCGRSSEGLMASDTDPRPFVVLVGSVVPVARRIHSGRTMQGHYYFTYILWCLGKQQS